MAKVRRKPPLSSPIFSMRLKTPGAVERLRRDLRSLSEVLELTQGDALTVAITTMLKQRSNGVE